ncbi:arylesterase [uncultured Oxalicibacterium sp.]|uniref:arylesterase n=1 Tax=uncultured Oxalicibacterium sp. TaxID=1168540 RepID=UPI0025F18450|nr:arylesterase [uncultured Oxalicibacterium sp.]
MMTLSMHAHSASKVVLVLGDSLSAEYGLARGEGWVSLMEKRMATEKVPATVVNASISGETTSGGRARLQTLLERHKPNVVVIELGANDALRGLSLPATRENLLAMTRSAQAIKAKVVLVGMQIPPNYGGDYTRQFAAVFPAVAKETNAVLVPFMLKGVAEKPELFQADRIHPAPAAHPIILDNIWPKLKPLLR